MGIETSGNKRKILFFTVIFFLLLVTATSVNAQEAPVANFTSNVTNGTAPLTVQFTDLSENATSLEWDFENDGIVDSNESTPTYTYKTADNYTVNLTAINENGTDTKFAEINVTEPGLAIMPVANFTSNVTNGTAPLTVQFTDLSENATSLEWDFGDGNNSTLQNPNNTYYNPGIYTVNLTAINENGTNSTQREINVTNATEPGIMVMPVANFTSNVSEGEAPLHVNFTDLSENATEWNWEFGDGNTSTDQNPNNTYYNPGSYDVNLTAINANGTNSTNKTINVTEPGILVMPIANFTSNVSEGEAPLNVNFTDLSENATEWNWEFGDGNTSTDQNPNNTYYNPGSYDVNLTAINANGTNSTNKTINVTEPGILVMPIANFTSNVSEGEAPLHVNFTDMSENATEWNWEFGDGNTSTDQNPNNTYYNPGSYDVNLTVSNANGTNSTNKTINVTEPGIMVMPVANFTSNVTNGTAPLTVQFNDTSLNATFLEWDFGDGNNSTLQNPNNTYYNPGIYTVNLTAINENGTNSTQREINVTNATEPGIMVMPVANFTSNVSEGEAPLHVNFTDMSENATEWNWEFGDGNTSTDQNPNNTYYNAGIYDVNLTASNANGTNSTTKTINVTEPGIMVMPVANFTSNVSEGEAPLHVNFTDMSENATEWNWEFGDGNTSTDQNPNNTYYNPGSYDVNLTASNENGTNSTTKTINVTEPGIMVMPVANFTSNVSEGEAPLTVQFNNTSLNATFLEWDFGDGNNSTLQNPNNTYYNPGIYTVNLTAINENGTDSTSRTINVTEPGSKPTTVLPVANFTSNVTSGDAPLAVKFTDLSENANKWEWDFGDGENSTEKDPIHTYSKAGNYIVDLTVSNENGTNSTSGKIKVSEPESDKEQIKPPKPIVVNNITIINTINNTVITNINIEEKCGCTAGGIAVNPEGTVVYVTNVYNNTVTVINTVTNNVIATVNVGQYPSGIAVAGTYVYVTNYYSNTVSVINTVTNTVVATVDVGECPTGITVAGKYVYVMNVYSNTVTVIDITTNTVIATVEVGQYPGGIAVSPDGTKVYVTNIYSNTVSVIDVATNKVIATVSVENGPTGIAVSEKYVYVANSYSSTVSIIDITTNTVIATVNVGTCPEGLIISPDGTKVYVMNSYSSTISIIDTATNEVTITTSAESTLIASGQSLSSFPSLKPATNAPPVIAGSTIYSSNVSVVDKTNNITATVNVGINHGGVAVSPDGTKVYATNTSSNTVSVIDTKKNKVIAEVEVGSYPVGVAVSPDGTKAYVTNVYSNTVSVIDTDTNKVTATVNAGSFPAGVVVSPDGKKVYVTNVNNNTVSVIDATTNKVTAAVIVGMYPWGIAVSPDGKKLYVTNIYSNTVSVIDTSKNKVIATLNAGSWPWGVAVSPDGTKVYVPNVYSNTVSVIDAEKNKITATIPVGAWPWGITVVGTSGYVAYSGSNTVSVIDTETNNVTSMISGGNPPIPFGESIVSLPALQPIIPIANLSSNTTCWCGLQTYLNV